jgi:hypothetical protein
MMAASLELLGKSKIFPVISSSANINHIGHMLYISPRLKGYCRTRTLSTHLTDASSDMFGLVVISNTFNLDG